MRILITGARGVIGSRLARALSQQVSSTGDTNGPQVARASELATGDAHTSNARADATQLPRSHELATGDAHSPSNARTLDLDEAAPRGPTAHARARELGETPHGSTAHEIVTTDRARLELTNAVSVQEMLDAQRPDVIVNCAANADVDACQREPSMAWAINAQVPATLAGWTARNPHARLVHLSTDYVFDGATGPYEIDAAPNPRTAYGESKLGGELAVRSIIPPDRWTIVRTAVVYGWPAHPGRSNFVATTLDTLKRGGRPKLFTDQWITPTHVSSAVELLVELIELGLGGIWHAAGSEFIDRFGFGVKLCERFGFDRALLEPISMASSGLTPRPPRAGLNVKRTAEALKTQPLSIAQSLDRLHAEFVGGTT